MRAFAKVLGYSLLGLAVGLTISVLVDSLSPAPGDYGVANSVSERLAAQGRLFGGAIILGLLAGISTGGRLNGWFLLCVPLIPLCLFGSELHLTLQLEGKDEAIRAFVGPDCTSSECLYQFLETIPMLASVAFALGAFVISLVFSRPEKRR